MRKCKTVSFDLTDEVEVELLLLAEEKGNFSRYVKRLIERDKSGWRLSNEHIEFEEVPVDVDDDISYEEEIEGEVNESDLSGYI